MTVIKLFVNTLSLLFFIDSCQQPKQTLKHERTHTRTVTTTPPPPHPPYHQGANVRGSCPPKISPDDNLWHLLDIPRCAWTSASEHVIL